MALLSESDDYLTLFLLKIFNGLVYLSIWIKPFIIFRENFIICND
jgi:hypothetical protein